MTVANLCAGPANSGGAIELALNFLCFFLFFKKKKEEDCYRRMIEIVGDAKHCVSTVLADNPELSGGTLTKQIFHIFPCQRLNKRSIISNKFLSQ